MKKVFSSILTVLALGAPVAATTVAIAPAAMAQHRDTATQIQDSGSYGRDIHFIEIGVKDYPLTSLMITLPPNVDEFNELIIEDSSGQEIQATSNISDDMLNISFAQPIQPGNDIRVVMKNVELPNLVESDSGIVQYRVSVMQEGLTEPIPLGYTRVTIPGDSDNNNS